MTVTHEQIRQGWKQFLIQLKPDYFVTLTFRVRFPDNVASSSAQFFLRSLYKLLPKPSRKHISGAVVVERTKQDSRFTGFYHFHFLFCHVIQNCPEPDTRLKNACIRSAGRIRDGAGRKAALPNNVYVINVYEPIGLAQYLTKMGEFPFDRDGLLIWLFDKNGIMHDLPDQPDRIWVQGNFDNRNATKRRRGAFYSAFPHHLGIRGKNLRTKLEPAGGRRNSSRRLRTRFVATP